MTPSERSNIRTRELWLTWDTRVMAKARMPREPKKGDRIVFELEPTLWDMRDSDIEMHCELVRALRGVFAHSAQFAVVVR